jgi:hypothetical protein
VARFDDPVRGGRLGQGIGARDGRGQLTPHGPLGETSQVGPGPATGGEVDPEQPSRLGCYRPRQGVLGVAASLGPAEHLVTDREGGHALAEGVDGAGDLNLE